jgi:hypothetical protein
VSNSAGAASGFDRPFLNGYTVEWSVATGEWVPRSDSSDSVLRGKDQAELDAARWSLVVTLADKLSQIIRHAPQHGYSPPPRT